MESLRLDIRTRLSPKMVAVSFNSSNFNTLPSRVGFFQGKEKEMSIRETVVCDYCLIVNEGPVVPDGWISADGEHFCNRFCAMTYWSQYDKGHYVGELA